MTANPPDSPPQPLADPQAAPPGTPPGIPKTSGHAVASLILGIVGPCTVGLASIPGLILGIVGLSKIKKSAGAMRGRGLAIAGIILSALGLLMLMLSPILAAILVPALTRASGLAKATVCKNNLKQLSMAAQIYAADREDALPSPAGWPQELEEYYASEKVLEDPACPDAGRAYAMNAGLRGMRLDSSIADPGRTVLFFECAPGSPPSGGPELLPPEPRHAGGHNIAFCDGHIEFVRPEGLDRLIWDPKADHPNN